MHQHHIDSIQNLVDYFSDRDEIIAVILGGSVAKGLERPDSDIDGMIVVTDEYYAKRKAEHALAEVIRGQCTYEAGYFDLKYYNKEWLEVAAKQGSEPARNAYLKSRVLFTKDPEIEELVKAIPVFQKQEKNEKLLSFYSDLHYAYYYFWNCKPIDPYQKVRTASEIVYCCYRIILQENEILFPCNRNLERAVEQCPGKPEGIIELAHDFLTKMDDASAKALVEATLGWMSYEPPKDHREIMTCYVADFELWWKNPRPFIHEW